MCYAKPGPRCSNAALMRLEKAKAARAQSQTFDRSADAIEKHFAAMEAVEEAQFEFDITPAGLLILEEQSGAGTPGTPAHQKLKYARQARAARLSAVQDPSDIPLPHVVTVPQTVRPAEAFQAGHILRQQKNPLTAQKEAMDDSLHWVAELSDEEIEALNWSTDFGAMEANEHIAGVNEYIRKWDAAAIEKKMKTLDGALAKYESSMPVLVYRGVREAAVPEHLRGYRVSNADKQEALLKRYQVGAEVETGFYTPTTVEPSMAIGFADMDVIFEVRTRKAAPVSAMSVVTRESERLLPRDAKLRVHAVLKDVRYAGYNRSFTVVQLEDAS